MQTDADVIIAGAGPAGSIAAHLLASKGLKVLVLEKAVFPRYKVCGAGLTPKIIAEIPYSLDPVIETMIHSVRFSCGFREVFTRTSEIPVMFCTMRDRLDHYMIRAAQDMGCNVQFGTRVAGYEVHPDHILVRTQDRSFRCTLLISAEGAAGTISHQAGLNRDISKGLAWEAELGMPEKDLRRFDGTVFLDWGTFPGGYGWVFPKKDHISAGVGGPASLSRQMKTYYHDFIHSIGGSGYETLALKSWPIPVRTKRGTFHKGAIMVAGDAAGLTDSMTGEGIFYAVKSGKLAAETALEYLQGRTGSLERYTRRINDELMEELLRAMDIKAVFNAVPLKIHTLVRDNDRVWRAFGKILRGDRCYADVPGGLGRFGFMWKIFVYISMIIYRYRIYLKQRERRRPPG